MSSKTETYMEVFFKRDFSNEMCRSFTQIGVSTAVIMGMPFSAKDEGKFYLGPFARRFSVSCFLLGTGCLVSGTVYRMINHYQEINKKQ